MAKSRVTVEIFEDLWVILRMNDGSGSYIKLTIGEARKLMVEINDLVGSRLIDNSGAGVSPRGD